MEKWLAKKRTEKALELLKKLPQKNRLLDLGCGSYPYFLLRTNFKEKYGMDPCVEDRIAQGKWDLALFRRDIIDKPLPFSANFFDAVTLLAVVEHVPEDSVVTLFSEIFRVLEPGGAFVLTTPASRTSPILKLFAFFHLVSPAEIAEHQKLYSQSELCDKLQLGGFSSENIKAGSFEIGVNNWVFARK